MNVNKLRGYVNAKDEYVSPRYMASPEPTVMHALERCLGLHVLDRLSEDMYEMGTKEFPRFDILMQGDVGKLEKALESYTKDSETLAKELKDAMQKAKSAREELDRRTTQEAEMQYQDQAWKGYPNPL